MVDESNKRADDANDQPVPTQAQIDRFRRGEPEEDEAETVASRKAPRKEAKATAPTTKDETDYSTRELANR